MTQARMDLTIKFSDLPATQPAEGGRVAFTLLVGDREVRVVVKAKAWKKVEAAAKEWPGRWLAIVTGKLGPVNGAVLEIVEAGITVVEKKGKPDEPAKSEPAVALAPGGDPVRSDPAPGRADPPAAAPKAVTLAEAHRRAAGPVVEHRRRPSREVADEFRAARKWW